MESNLHYLLYFRKQFINGTCLHAMYSMFFLQLVHDLSSMMMPSLKFLLPCNMIVTQKTYPGQRAGIAAGV
jgi:hypothetical protein